MLGARGVYKKRKVSQPKLRKVEISVCCLQSIVILEYICKNSDRHEVQLEDIDLGRQPAGVNRSAGEMLRKARCVANNPDMQQGSLDDFYPDGS